MTPLFWDAICEPRSEVSCNWYTDGTVAVPAFWIDRRTTGHLVLKSLTVKFEEQLAAAPVLAEVFSLYEVGRLTLPRMRPGDPPMELTFENLGSLPIRFALNKRRN